MEETSGLVPISTRLKRIAGLARQLREQPLTTLAHHEGSYKPATFDFLGFTIHWGKSLAGKWAVKTRTASDRFQRALKGISQWCKAHRHEPLLPRWRPPPNAAPALVAHEEGHRDLAIAAGAAVAEALETTPPAASAESDRRGRVPLVRTAR
jgi:hypothetical protein